ncbi:carbohydrate kinase family protein [Cohnella thailandensis]|uniref:Carbohydrate kinase n=1 Tax=Cohnella thailandensis TaxID=557557 RepID=A0A841SWP5_9BACL|nr:carbohydrate kinase [Cohnella thailandensis]MBB6634598.1 carbohydrate kinase [Cohnella thailandensis]MBP1972846.1 fructokinase [Cohnella thailandensis]
MDFQEALHFEDKPNDLLTVGELLVDMISDEYDDTFMSNGYTKYPGGSPSNIAINAKKLGIRSQIAACVGNDGFGDYLLEWLSRDGLSTHFVQRADESTSMVVVTRSRATPIPIFYRGADYKLSYSPLLEGALLNSKAMHFSCWPLSRVPSRQTIERAIDIAKAHGVKIGFDPNYHRMIWQKGEDGVSYVKSILSKADFVKPSEDDAERLFGQDTPTNQLEKFLELGAKLVILTLGKDGALVSNGKETKEFATMASEVADTTGAGDAFWSGFYAAALKGYPLEEALRLGFAVSAYKLKYAGAVVDLPKLEEIKIQYRL